MNNFELDIKKAQIDRVNAIQKSFEGDNDIEKGQKANIGEIHTWGGKKYKKQANGKWMEVSEHGKTKEEHSDESKNKRVIAWNTKDDEYRKKYSDESKLNEEAASKLSDKEDESELSGEERN